MGLGAILGTGLGVMESAEISASSLFIVLKLVMHPPSLHDVHNRTVWRARIDRRHLGIRLEFDGTTRHMAKRTVKSKKATRKKPAAKKPIESYDHKDKKRANNPPVGLVTPDTDPDHGKKKTYEYDPHRDPQLVWAGKAEHTSFEVPTVSLHVHERLPRCVSSWKRAESRIGSGGYARTCSTTRRRSMLLG